AHPQFRDPMAGRLARLRQRFSTFGPRVAAYLAALERDDEVICSAMEWMELGNIHAGRVVLVGDAAHASSPMTGQGGWMAMEDPCGTAGDGWAALWTAIKSRATSVSASTSLRTSCHCWGTHHDAATQRRGPRAAKEYHQQKGQSERAT